MKIAIKNIYSSKDSTLIKIFLNLEGKNTFCLKGHNHDEYYYINENNIITLSTKKDLIKKGYTCHDSISEYQTVSLTLDTSGSLKSEDLNPIYSPKTINYTDI